MSGREDWDQREEDYLRKNYPTIPNRRLAEDLDRSVNSIQLKAIRLGLVKETPEEDEAEFVNLLETMSRDEAKRLDKLDLLAINWSLLKMYERELTNPKLSAKLRVKLMVAMGNHTETISNIMKGSEEQLGAEEDLEKALVRLEDRRAREAAAASSKMGMSEAETFVVVKVKKKEGGEDEAEGGDPQEPRGAGP